MRRRIWSIAGVLAMVAAVLPLGMGAALAVTCSVPSVAYPTIASAAADGTCSVIDIAAGTYVESGIAFTTPGVTVQGAGAGSTIVDPGGGNVFLPRADDQTFKDLTIRNSSQAMRFEVAGGTIDNTEISGVAFESNSSRAIEIHNATTVSNLRVLDSTFDGNRMAMRWASNAVGDGVVIDGSTFENHSSLVIYQANDGSTGYVRDLTITDNVFTDNASVAVYGEELRGVEIAGNEFTRNSRGFNLFHAYDGAPELTGDIWIHDNVFTDQAQRSVLIWSGPFQAGVSAELDLPVLIEGNVIDEDVSVLALNYAQIDLFMLETDTGGNPLDHAPVTVRGNDITLSGSFTGGATAAYAAKVRGDYDGVSFTGNTFDGGGVGSSGGVPPTSAIFVLSDTASYGGPTAGSVFDVSHNTITGFVNGVSVYDEVAAAVGGLPPGNDAHVNRNAIVGNTGLGIENGPAGLDGTCNWWGDPFGPSGAGSGSGDAVSSDVTFAPWLISADLDGVCNGGTPRGLKQATVAALATALPTGDAKADKWIGKAIDRIEASLHPAWWIDDSTLDPDDGKSVFDRERQAVIELTKKDVVDNPSAQAAVQVLLDADEALAQKAIDDAVAAAGDPGRIAKANADMAKAADEITNGNFPKAVEYFRKAWQQAQKAMP